MHLKKHPFTSSFSQEVVTYDLNLCIDIFLFNSFSENENIDDNISKTNKIDPNSLFIYIFKEMTNLMKDQYCLEDIKEVRELFTKKMSNQRKRLLPY